MKESIIKWHEFASSRNVESLIDLYDAHAILESPLVPIIMGCCSSGVLTGRDEILAFLIEGTKRRQMNSLNGIEPAHIM